MLRKIWIFKNLTIELKGLFETIIVKIKIFENMTVQEQILLLRTNNKERIKKKLKKLRNNI